MSTARKPLVAGNWKLNKLIAEAVETVEALKPLVADVSNVDIAVCPVYTALHAAAKAAAGSNIEVGAQNVYTKESGAFTGEVSPQMIKDTGCSWVIIGHSERRQYFGEDDALLNEKLHFALSAGLKVMFCIGETLEEREGGKMDHVLTRQITEGLKGVSDEQFASVAIAYEPIWAIGTGVTASPEQAESAHLFVRDLVRKLFGDAVADGVRIQYGGSAKPGNAAELISQPNVDGFLVGGAALKADSFAGIITAVSAHG